MVVDDAADADADADNVTLLQMTDITNKEVDMDNLFCISTLLQILFSMALNSFQSHINFDNHELRMCTHSSVVPRHSIDYFAKQGIGN